MSDALFFSDESSLPAAKAPFFKFYDEMPEVDREKPQWHCTGEYLKKHRPKIYEQAVMMLCEPGISIRSICRTLHVSHNTLSSILEREQSNLDTRKKDILRTITRGLRLCAERVEELAPSMNARDALVGVGILGEKMQLLGGEATQRIESFEPVDLVARFQTFVRELEERVRAREIAAQIGLADQKKLLNRDNEDEAKPVLAEAKPVLGLLP
jgi:transposase-like protein